MHNPNRNPSRLCSGRSLFTLMIERRRAPISVSRVLAANALLLFFFVFLSSPAHAQTLRVAAAADLQFVLTDLASQYEKQTGARVAITYGSSGSFFAQIQNGAPFDLFLSADLDYPKKLTEAGFAESDSSQIYAAGRLALWLPPDSPLDPNRGLETLLRPPLQKIPPTQPQHPPFYPPPRPPLPTT